ncbi:lycopene cyclase family protein [Actinosynnema sp. NPDC047251]|uniref:Lycopene cyclase n=1 Tax=Saccharothrix espanaensis (strain ATCC 51144 / DSM 44229 / JCM 9112 / NBRC 15066 / NRRL 15764) TaxID=1179773 RepID=K0K599_SACES|nr:lycopene cyclase family protein [Saccharothrix espanaensis]CCH33471.1 Lycopene cyclase [Saccharothrix espanaensis DSM 44229]
MDVLIVGGGPAGRALASACSARGLVTSLVDPHPGRPWRATYAAWADELPVDAPVAVSTSKARVFATSEHRIARGYAVLDNERLRRLPDDVRVVRGLVAERGRRHVVLRDGRVLRAGLVVDATGASGRVAQHAVGVVVAAEQALPFVVDDEALVMDWRRPPDAGSPDPTFLYAIPMPGGGVLLEETSLARGPGLPLPELRLRLRARLAAHGVALPHDEERVRIPLAARPRRGAFGAAAGLVHPATGYSVAEALALAPEVARAIADGVPVDRVVWPARARAVHALRRYGLAALLVMRPDQVPEFFDLFFHLPENKQRMYLSGRSDLHGTVSAMSALFRTADWRMRARLAFTVQPAKAVRTPG